MLIPCFFASTLILTPAARFTRIVRSRLLSVLIITRFTSFSSSLSSVSDSPPLIASLYSTSWIGAGCPGLNLR